MHFALRRLLVEATRPVLLMVLAIVAAVVGLSGPFGTFEALPPLVRLAYWAAVVFLTFFVGYGASALAAPRIPERTPWPLRILIVGIASGIPVTLVVLVLNALTFPANSGQPLGAFALLVYCTLISIGVAVLLDVIDRQAKASPRAAGAPESADPPQAMPRLMDRVPPQLRGPLVSLSVTDHYVEVTTTRGRALLLMRLRDAIAETAGVEGLQIHRSHWVARSGIAKLLREDARLVVETTAGNRLPVSRSFQSALRTKHDAG